MLSGALGFLTEKRVPFTRSETMSAIDLGSSIKRVSTANNNRHQMTASSLTATSQHDFSHPTAAELMQTTSTNPLAALDINRRSGADICSSCSQLTKSTDREFTGSDGDLSISKLRRQFVNYCQAHRTDVQKESRVDEAKKPGPDNDAAVKVETIPSGATQVSCGSPETGVDPGDQTVDKAGTNKAVLQEAIVPSQSFFSRPTTSGVGGKGRLARMKAKAAKLKRSSSSAQIGHRVAAKRAVSPDSHSGTFNDSGRGRSTSIERDAAPASSWEDLDHQLVASPSARLHENLLSTSWTASSSNIIAAKPSSKVKLIEEHFLKLASADSPLEIDCSESSAERHQNWLSPVPYSDWADRPKQPLRSDLCVLLDQRSESNKAPKVRFEDSQHKPVIRAKAKLRRNNSSIIWSSANKTNLAAKQPDSSPVQLTDTAGDLIIAARKAPRTPNGSTPTALIPSTQLIRDELFNIIHNDALHRFLDKWPVFVAWSRDLAHSPESTANPFGLSPLDVAFLSGSTRLISWLLAGRFQPGPVLLKALLAEPIDIAVCNVLKNHLTDCMQQLDVALNSTRSIHTDLTEQMTGNRMNILDKDGQIVLDQFELVAKRLTEVVEPQLRKQLTARCQLEKYCEGLSQYPLFPLPPNRVTVVTASNDSILVKVSPPVKCSVQWNTGASPYRLRSARRPSTKPMNDSQSSTQSSDEGGGVNGETIERGVQDGRKVSERNRSNQILDNSSLILRYRIEWSTDRDFKSDTVSSCLVVPPIDRCQLIDQVNNTDSTPGNHPGIVFAKGYYKLTDLVQDQVYYIRVFSFSVRGWSSPCYARPRAIAPSAWYTCPTLTDLIDRPIAVDRFVGTQLDTELSRLIQAFDKEVNDWLERGLIETFNPSPTSAVTNDDAAVVVRKTKSPKLQRKRSFRFLFNNKTIKFVKQAKSGLYFAVLAHTPLAGQVEPRIVLLEDTLPLLSICKEEYTGSMSALQSDLSWLSRIINHGANAASLPRIVEQLLATSLPTACQLRVKLLTAVNRIRAALGCSKIGAIYPELFRDTVLDTGNFNVAHHHSSSLAVIDSQQQGATINDGSTSTITIDSISQEDTSVPSRSNSSIIIVLVKCVDDPESLLLTGNLKWVALEKFSKQNKLGADLYPLFYPTNPDDSAHGSATYNLSQLHWSPRGQDTADSELELSRLHHIATSRSENVVPGEVKLLTHLDRIMVYSQRRLDHLEPGLYLALVQMQARLDQQPNVLIGSGSATQPTSSSINMLPVEMIRRRWHVSQPEWQSLVDALQQADTDRPTNVRRRSFTVSLTKAWRRMASRLNLSDSAAFRIYLPEVVRISPQHSLIIIVPPCDQVCLPPLVSARPLPTCSWFALRRVERNMALVYDSHFFVQASGMSAMLDLLLPIVTYLRRQCLTNADLSRSRDRAQLLEASQAQVEQWMASQRWLSETINLTRSKKKAVCLSINLFLMAPNQSTTARRQPITTLAASLDATGGDWCRLRIFADYPSGLASGTSVRLLINFDTTAREIVDLVVETLTRTSTSSRGVRYRQRRLELAGFVVDGHGEDTDALRDSQTMSAAHSWHWLSVGVDNELRNVAPNLRPLLFDPPWRCGRFSVHRGHQPPTFHLIPQHHPTSSTLPSFQPAEDEAKHQEQPQEENSFKILKVPPKAKRNRHVKLYLKIVGDHLHHAHVNEPPRVCQDNSDNLPREPVEM